MNNGRDTGILSWQHLTLAWRWWLNLPRRVRRALRARGQAIQAIQQQRGRSRWKTSGFATQQHGMEPMEGRVHLSVAPIFDSPLETQYMTVTRALTVGIDGFDADGDDLTISVDTNTPGITAYVPEGNSFARMRYVDVDDEGNRTHIGDIIVELFEDRGSTAAERFITLATNEVASNGTLDPGGTPFYTDVIVHRIVPGFVIQTGDAVNGTGSGGSPLGSFDDDFDDTLAFTGKGVLAMANSGPDTNNSQWFITAAPTPSLDPFEGNSKHMIFGQVVKGYDVYEEIITRPRNSSDRPLDPPLLESVEIFENNEDFSITFAAEEGFEGGTFDVEVTLTDSDGMSVTEIMTLDVVGLDRHTTFTAEPGNQLVLPGLANGGGAARNIDLSAVSSLSDANIVAHDGSGEIRVTPPSSFTGYFEITVGAVPADLTLHAARQSYGIVVQPGERGLPLQFRIPAEAQGKIAQVAVVGDVLYAALTDGGVAAYDISDTSDIQLLDTLDTGNGITRLAANGDTIFALDDDEGLVVIDASDPTSLNEIDTLALGADGRNLRLHNNRLYVAAGSKGLLSFDVSDADAVTQLAAVTHHGSRALGTVTAVERVGNYIYATSANFLSVFELQGSTLRPRFEAAINGQPVDVKAYENRLYVADSLLGMTIFDITRSQRPVRAGSFSAVLQNITGVDVINETAILSHSSDRGFTLVDVSSPNSAVAEGQFKVPESGGKPLVLGDDLLLPMGEDGMVALDGTRLESRQTVLRRSVVTHDDGSTTIIHASTGGYGPQHANVRVFTSGPNNTGDIERIVILSDNSLTNVRIIHRGSQFVEVGEMELRGDVRSVVTPHVRYGSIETDARLRVLIADELSGVINIEGDDNIRDSTYIRANRIVNASITSEIPIRAIVAGEWIDDDDTRDVLSAPEIGHVRILGYRNTSGDFQADIAVDGDRRFAMRNFIARGTVSDSDWRIEGDVISVQAGALDTTWRANVEGNVRRLVSRGTVGGTLAADNLGLGVFFGDAQSFNLLIGTDLGNDLALGGSGSANADAYGAGVIGNLIFRGSVDDSTISAGIDPGNTTLNDGDDQRLIGGVVRRAMVMGTVTDSRFAAETYPRFLRIDGQLVVPIESNPAFLMTEAIEP